jgi:AcrR family transcriptional regulator
MAKGTRSMRRSKAGAKAGKSARAARPARSGDPADRVIECALTLAVERGWRRITMSEIAAASNLSLAELFGLYRSKEAILSAFVRRIDREVLAGGVSDGESARDRLFDVLMRRFEALNPHKTSLEAILRDCGVDPLGMLCGGLRLRRSMAWMLEAAGIQGSGLLGRARVKGLALVYLATMRVWLGDDSEDMSRTMAALDKRLRRAESLANLCSSLGRRRFGRGEASEARAA